MKKLFVFFVFIIILKGTTLCQSFTVSGYIIDKETRETLIGVAVMIKGTSQGVISDNNGYFSMLNLKNGDYTFQFSCMGYEKLERKIHVENKSILLSETALTPEIVKLGDVTVVGTRPDSIGDREVETSQLKISAATIRNIPTAQGDIFKAIKYLPGIEATDPFSPLFSVRGGDPSGNLVLLDGVTVYNPYHYATADGLFNIQTIKDIDLFVGGFGAEYGGRNSSILYITTKDGTMDKLHGEFEPTTTHTKLFLEFPVGKNSSMMVAGRYFYNLPTRFILDDNSYFYDLNVSYTNRLNSRNRLTIKLFDSQDKSDFNFDRFGTYLDNAFETDIYDDFHLSSINNWSNKIATAYLKTIISPSIYLRTQVYGSFHKANIQSGLDFHYSGDSIDTPFQLTYNSKFTSKIDDICAKSILSIGTDRINTFHLGYEWNGYIFKNGAELQEISSGKSTRMPSLLALFAEDKVHIGNLIIRPGIRASHYSYNDNWNFEPRMNLTWNLPADIKFKAAWGIYYQNIISMNTQEYELSQFLDYYYPLKNHALTKSIHYITGIEKPIGRYSVLSANVYFIDMPLTYMFDLNLNQLEASTFSDKLEQGSGEAYGIELFWKGQYKKLSGWISYCISKSTRSYSFINDGKPFLFDYDRAHSFKGVVSYKTTSDLTYNASLVVQSGLPKTLETTLQNYFYYDPVEGSVANYPFGVENNKNNARLPMSIDLDFGLTKRIRKGFGADLADFLKADKSYLTVTIGNILFLHRNVIWYFPFGENKYIPVGLNYLPSVSVGYVIKF